MSGTPQNWIRREFGELAEIINTRWTADSQSNARTCIELEHIEGGTGRVVGKTDAADGASTKAVFQKGDVLFGKLRPYLRKYWLAESEGVCSTEIWVLRARPAAAVPGFVHLLVQTDGFQRWANMTSGSKMPRADWDLVSGAPFWVPPVQEQQRICQIAQASTRYYNGLCDLLERKKQAGTALTQQLIAGTLRLPGVKYAWRDRCLGDLFRNRRERGQSHLPVMSVTQNDGLVERTCLDRKTDSTLTAKEHLLVRQGDIAYNMMRMWQGAYGIARHDGIVSPAYIVLAPSDEIDSEFASYWFRSNRLRYLLWAYSYGLTDDRLRLYYKDFARIPVTVLPIDAQRAIAAVLRTCDSEIALLRRQLKAFKNLKNGLVQKVLTGQIRVKE